MNFTFFKFFTAVAMSVFVSVGTTFWWQRADHIARSQDVMWVRSQTMQRILATQRIPPTNLVCSYTYSMTVVTNYLSNVVVQISSNYCTTGRWFVATATNGNQVTNFFAQVATSNATWVFTNPFAGGVWEGANPNNYVGSNTVTWYDYTNQYLSGQTSAAPVPVTTPYFGPASLVDGVARRYDLFGAALIGNGWDSPFTIATEHLLQYPLRPDAYRPLVYYPPEGVDGAANYEDLSQDWSLIHRWTNQWAMAPANATTNSVGRTYVQFTPYIDDVVWTNVMTNFGPTGNVVVITNVLFHHWHLNSTNFVAEHARVLADMKYTRGEWSSYGVGSNWYWKAAYAGANEHGRLAQGDTNNWNAVRDAYLAGGQTIGDWPIDCGKAAAPAAYVTAWNYGSDGYQIIGWRRDAAYVLTNIWTGVPHRTRLYFKPTPVSTNYEWAPLLNWGGVLNTASGICVNGWTAWSTNDNDVIDVQTDPAWIPMPDPPVSGSLSRGFDGGEAHAVIEWQFDTNSL